jgi:hypothetical protein
VAAAACPIEQRLVEGARQPLAPGFCRHGHTVDIGEAGIARLEPEEILASIVGVLVEGEHEGLEAGRTQRQKGLADQMLELFRLEPREFARMVVVEGQDRVEIAGPDGHEVLRHGRDP